MSMSKEGAKRIRDRAIAYQNQERLRGTPVILPSKKINNPTKWVVLEGANISPAGSILRFNRGDEVDQVHIYNALVDSGAVLAPIG